MYKVILDTDTFSEIIKEKNNTLKRKASNYEAILGRFTITAITAMEVLRGLYQKKRYPLIEAFHNMNNEIIIPCQDCYFLAGKIQGELLSIGQDIGISDTLIASVAVTNCLPLVTRNTEHFQRVTNLGYDLILADWTKQ
jgi:tRNA(fMet)-specific endonuclease VapC